MSGLNLVARSVEACADNDSVALTRFAADTGDERDRRVRADLGAKHMLLREGIGWGYMPEPTVREDLQARRLIRLDIAEYKDGFVRLHAIYRTDTPPGPAGSWLVTRFAAPASGPVQADNRSSMLRASLGRRKKSASARRA